MNFRGIPHARLRAALSSARSSATPAEGESRPAAVLRAMRALGLEEEAAALSALSEGALDAALSGARLPQDLRD